MPMLLEKYHYMNSVINKVNIIIAVTTVIWLD